MARRQKKSELEETTEIQENSPDTVTETRVVPEAREVPVQTPAVPPSSPKPSAPKKRIRVRKKTTKHLSVAVLCANPNTRRFI